LVNTGRVAIPRPVDAAAGACSDCGNSTFTDGYCSGCGHRRAAPDRDQAEIDGIVLVTDRGIEHHRNEDAAAAGSLTAGDGRPAGFAIVVSDGVSSSEEPQRASLAAATAGVDSMLGALRAVRDSRAAVVAGLAAATRAAASAHTGSSTSTAPSCTYTAAAVIPADDGTAQIALGNVGDSRAYWLAVPPDTARQLTTDDSLSQELIATGLPPDSPAVLRGAHTITRWLGADSEPQPWADSSVQSITTTGPGWLLLCSDGLWNYLPGADELLRFCTGKDATSATRELVEYALAAGGQDNITVAVIPIGGPT
jgi:serine/threonine protein phosphatase PrpC